MDDKLVEIKQLLADCNRMGKEFVASLKQKTGNHDVIGIPEALAAVFDELIIQNKLDLNSFYLKATIETLTGARMERYAPGIEELHKRLQSIGAISSRQKVNNGGDNYMYSLSGSEFWRYVLVFETQNYIYTVLMRYGNSAEGCPEYIQQMISEYGDDQTKDIITRSYSPQIYIAQQYWENKNYAQMEQYAQLDYDHLPSWQDDRNLDGYVAFLKDGKVTAASYYYDKICRCLYTLASFIEFKDELELD